MRVRGKGATLKGPEGSSPPLPYLTVDDAEGRYLIRLGIAEEVPEEAPAAPAKSAKAPAKPKTDPAPPPPPPPPPPPAETPKEEPQGEERGETILHALDLVEHDGFEAEGPRQGKPTVAAIEAITGLADVTTDEIDAALAKHSA